MSALGQKQTYAAQQCHVRFTPNCDCKSGYLRFVMSALPPKADMCSAAVPVRFGPKADSCAPTHVRFTPNSDGESGLRQKVMSALPLKADMCGATSDVRFGPIADITASFDHLVGDGEQV